MTVEERGSELVITRLPVEQMGILALGLALEREEQGSQDGVGEFLRSLAEEEL